ncbi:putative methyltransferase DDB_G0268948 [Impatiens glandulifera]|uniref:putative methyltransferase DDB_G0268948 n=1 Tax=Impatiens glandulifera TaxID=253017 RepID=UPI001FB1475C|nr:putative methyltransferase DDB_G0268948 [Impatiens glandulifera]
MAGLFDKQAEIYADARPTYPKEWYSMLAGLTSSHTLAWDVATGNGQAAIGVAEYYEHVVATEVSKEQLNHVKPHPRIRYEHTPLSLNDDDLVKLVGGEGTVDLITVATAIHWFDLSRFYSVVNRLLRTPGGVLAVWTYSGFEVFPLFDVVFKRFSDTTLPYFDPKVKYVLEEYRTLPFPFERLDLGFEGNPKPMDMKREVSFAGFLRFLRSYSGVTTAKERGVDLLSKEVVGELESAWGGPSLIRKVVYKGWMLIGRVKK